MAIINLICISLFNINFFILVEGYVNVMIPHGRYGEKFHLTQA